MKRFGVQVLPREKYTARGVWLCILILLMVSHFLLSPVEETRAANVTSNGLWRILVAERENPVIDARLERKMSTLQAGYPVVLWIFFTDKGIFTEEDYEAALNRTDAGLCDRVRKRRAKMGSVAGVDFRDLPVHQDYIRHVLEKSLRHRTTSKWFNAISVEVEVGRINEMARLPFVRKIREVARFKRLPVPEIRTEEISQIKSPSRHHPHGMNYGSSLPQLQQINVPAVHELGYKGQGVIVCLLDTGFFLEHESLEHIDLIAEWDFIFNDGTTANEEEDSPAQHYHGSEVLSVIAGAKDGKLYGPAYEASYLLAKTEDTRSETPIEEDFWVAGIEWAESEGADVVSSSVGYTAWYSYEDGDYDGNTAVTTKAADIAVSKGIVVCNAMGNGGQLVGSIITPADADSIIACGAVDGNGNLAGFSSIGPTNDGRIKPEVLARGASTYAALPSPHSSDGYTTVGGTSFSTPLVAGCAALIIQAHPDWTPMQVREALMMTASRADYPDNLYGWGIVDCLKAIHYPEEPNGDGPALPERFELAQNYPNPFNPSTSIRYSVVSDQSPPHVTLKIFNILGQEVKLLVDEVRKPGYYTVTWDGTDRSARSVSSGVYYYRLSVGGGQWSEIKRMVLLK